MRPTARRAAAATVLVVASLAIPASGDDLIACTKIAPGAIDVRKDGWAKIRYPLHTGDEGPASVVSFATSPGLENRMFSTNGHVIKTTANAGCTWQTIWRGNQAQPPSSPATDGIDVDVFTHIVAPSNDTLWVAAYDDNDGVPKPRVYSLDLGPEGNNAEPPQTTVDNALPPTGKPVALEVTKGIGTSSYVLIEGVSDATAPVVRHRRLFTTFTPDQPPQAAAIGEIWKELTPPEGFGEIAGIEAPANKQLLIWSGSDYAITQDTLADEVAWKTGSFDGEIVTATVGRSGTATLVVKASQGSHGVQVDIDTAEEMGTVSFPIAPTAITLGDRGGVMAVSGPKGTHGYDVGLDRWLNLTPKGAKQPFSQMFMANGVAGRYLVGVAPDAFWRFDTFEWELFRAPPPLDFFGDLNLGTVPRSNLKNLVLTPTKAEVTVEPGKLHREPVELKVPPAPNRLDVYFLVDTTGSMQPSIDGLKRNVMAISAGLRTLLDQPREVCFGVGDFKDESGSGGAATSGGDLSYVYRARQKIVCENDPTLPLIKVALDQMRANIGGSDLEEAQNIALVQAIKGTGHGSPGRYYVAPDQDAGFRPDALKVIVLISDAPGHSGGPYPTTDEAIEALNSVEAKFVGVHTLNQMIDETKAYFTEMAVGTRTYAPAEGVDCDGDGKFTKGVDLRPGAALVCQTSGSEPNIGGAVLGLLMGVQDPGSIAVHVGDEHNVVQEPIDGPTVAIRNLKRESHLDFGLPLMCTKKQDGQDLEVQLLPTVRARPYNPLGTITVKCRSKIVAPPPPIPPEPVQELVIKPKPRPPQAIPLQPPVQPPAISNINLNAGFSQQEEQQYQLATVGQDASEQVEEEEVELAMVGLPRPEREVAGAAVPLTGAVLLSSVAGLAYRRRLRLQRQRAVRYVNSR